MAVHFFTICTIPVVYCKAQFWVPFYFLFICLCLPLLCRWHSHLPSQPRCCIKLLKCQMLRNILHLHNRKSEIISISFLNKTHKLKQKWSSISRSLRCGICAALLCCHCWAVLFHLLTAHLVFCLIKAFVCCWGLPTVMMTRHCHAVLKANELKVLVNLSQF